MKCAPKPIGCGREISEAEYWLWDNLSQKEFRISGLCLDPCQNEYFAEPPDDWDEDDLWEEDE